MLIRKSKEKQKMVGFGEAIKNFWAKYFTFSGVAQRSEYWFAVLFVFLLWVLLVLMARLSQVMVFIDFVLVLIVATFVPFLSLAARRVHDIGISAKWLWLLLIPGGLFVLFAYFLPMALAVSVMYYTPANEIYMLRCAWAFMGFVATSVVMFILFSLPSKTKNNPYRK